MNALPKVSVVAGTFGADAREAARLAREAGFGGIQFDATGAGLRIPDLSGTGRREFRLMLSNQQLHLVGLRVDLGHLGFGPGADVDRVLFNVDRAMEAAAGLGSPLVCVEAGPLPEPARVAEVKPKVTAAQAGLILLPESIEPAKASAAVELKPPDPAFVSQVDAAMGELGAKADRYGVMLAFASDLSSLSAIHEALRRVKCPWFGLDLDPVAVLRDEWGIDEIFSRLGGSIHHVRGRDAIKGTDRRTKPATVGRGGTDWNVLRANLDGAGYAGWVTVDPVDLTDRRAAAVAGLEHLGTH